MPSTTQRQWMELSSIMPLFDDTLHKILLSLPQIALHLLPSSSSTYVFYGAHFNASTFIHIAILPVLKYVE